MLNKYRKQIDKIDKKLARLFEKRMDVAKRIGEYKKENGMEFFVAEREKAILDERSAEIKNPQYKEYAKEFFEKLMCISKEIQNKK